MFAQRSPVKSARSGKTLTAHELARFLFYLARTGNFGFACERIGRAKSGLSKRRARDPDFDAECRDAIAQARCHLWRADGPVAPIEDDKYATVLGTYRGCPQLRRAVPGTLTRAGQERFLSMLAATGNVRFAAHSVGVQPSSIHARRRRDPAFAARMQQAIDTAVAELEMRIVEASGVFSDEPVRPERVEGSARTSAPTAIGALTVGEALHFLTLNVRGRRGKNEW